MLTNATFFSALLKIIKDLHCEKLSEMQFDDQLKFDFYIENLFKNANRKLHALARVTPDMDLSKKRILLNAFLAHKLTITVH